MCCSAFCSTNIFFKFRKFHTPPTKAYNKNREKIVPKNCDEYDKYATAKCLNTITE